MRRYALQVVRRWIPQVFLRHHLRCLFWMG